MAGKLPGGLPDSPKNLRHCWPRGMFLASNICWVSSGTSSRAKQYLESTAALKGEFATWVRDGQGAVLLRPAGGQRGEARHEEVQACRGSAVVGGVVFKAEFHKAQIITSAFQATRERHQVDGDLAQVAVQPCSPMIWRSAGNLAQCQHLGYTVAKPSRCPGKRKQQVTPLMAAETKWFRSP